MIEGESDFVGEEEMMRAIEVGHAAVRDLCLGEHLASLMSRGASAQLVAWVVFALFSWVLLLLL